jgi:predicted phosphodiesterase
MNILILSDLHIDTSDTFGTFQWDDLELITYIERLRYEYNIEKVILNGDIFELMKYRYEDIAKAHPRLIKYFLKNKFIYIKGNHDLMMDYGLENYQIVNSAGQVIHIEHGHRADWFNGSKIGRSFSRFALGFLKKMSKSSFMMTIYFRIVAFEDQINHIPKNYNTLKYLTYALRLLRKYDVIILAHTHKLEAHHTYYLHKKKRYLNCGTCSLGRFQGILMDMETLRYEMIKETRESVAKKYTLAYAI